MSEELTRNTKMDIFRFHFSVKLKSIFFPLALGEVLPVIEEVGYLPRKELLEAVKNLPDDRRLIVGGAIADKSSIGGTFRMDPASNVIAIAGKNILEVIQDFTKIEQIVEERLQVAIEKQAQFYEFVGDGAVVTGRDPTKVTAKVYHDSKLLAQLSEILGFSATNFGVRIVEQNMYATEAHWSEIVVEPLLPKADTTYHFTAVYRDPERAKVVGKAHSLTDHIEKTIYAMEKEA